LKDHQREQLRLIRNNLKMNEVIVFVDFVGFEFSLTKCKTNFINALVFALEWKDDQLSTHRQYINVVSDTQKTNFAFVYQGFVQPFQSGSLDNFSKLFIFSDNAGKQFKNRRTLRLISLLLQQYHFNESEWHMFASNHGWSLCGACTKI
jgi:hypothetical protein